MADQKLGTEFQVNTYQPDDQEAPAIAMDASGNFVITWDSEKQDSSRLNPDVGVYAQRYTKDGISLGGEFRVNTTLDRSQANPDIAMNPNGDFVVIWQGEGNDPSRGTGADNDRGIFAQRYNNAGIPVGVEFQVNSTIANAQTNPTVAMDAAGNFVAIWGSDNTGIRYNLFAQRFNAQGIPQGGEFLVAAPQIAGGPQTDVAMDANGNFVVTWAEQGDAPRNSIFTQRYDRSGTPSGSPFLVGSFNDSGSGKPAVDMDAAGNFVVSWYGGGGKILARRYSSLGAAQGSELLVTSAGNNPDVGFGNDGDFVVTWTTAQGIKARRFDRNNTPQGTEFQVSTTRANPFEPGAIAIDAAGNYTVAWQGSTVANGEDNIYAQRFADSPASDNNPGRIIRGSAKADRLRGTSGNDTLTGLGGNDRLIGNRGDDRLLGGAGKDTLTGGAGLDILIGGRGGDRFVLPPLTDRFVLQVNVGLDIIQDFRNGQDKLLLSGSIRFGSLEITQSGNNTLIRLQENVLVQLAGVSANQINAADFVLR